MKLDPPNDIEEKVHVEMVDAVNCWVPVKSKPLGNNIYSILEINDFDTCIHEFGELYGFFPGDIVEAIEHTWSGGKKGKLAIKLVTASTYPDRKYFDFLFKMLKKRISFDKKTFDEYKTEIERIKKESASDKYFKQDILIHLNEFETAIQTS